MRSAPHDSDQDPTQKVGGLTMAQQEFSAVLGHALALVWRRQRSAIGREHDPASPDPSSVTLTNQQLRPDFPGPVRE